MQNAWKPFGERGTDSPNRHTKQAVFALTAWYITILAITLFLSGAFTRALLPARIFPSPSSSYGNVAQDVPPLVIERRALRKELENTVLVVNGILLILGAIGSYFFAKNTLKPITQAQKQQEAFFAHAAHELRTPLAILQAQIENRIHDAKSEKEKQEHHESREEIARITTLVNDMLALAKEDTKQHMPTLQNISLTETITNILHRLTPLAKQASVTLTNTINKTYTVRATNKEDLTHALENLLTNAIRYNKKSGEVTVHAEKNKKEVTLTIHDTGVGMEASELAHLGERFYRSEKSRSRTTGGSGLGFCIAQNIIENSGGKIQVTSTPNVGTDIKITLPQ